jgi:DNA-binding FadR family transcriptional regulator
VNTGMNYHLVKLLCFPATAITQALVRRRAHRIAYRAAHANLVNAVNRGNPREVYQAMRAMRDVSHQRTSGRN